MKELVSRIMVTEKQPKEKGNNIGEKKKDGVWSRGHGGGARRP